MPGHFSSLIRTYVIIINFQNRMKPPKCLNLFSTLTVVWQITGKARDAELSDGRLSNPCLNHHHSCQNPWDPLHLAGEDSARKTTGKA